jgi:hypothetical protein
MFLESKARPVSKADNLSTPPLVFMAWCSIKTNTFPVSEVVMVLECSAGSRAARGFSFQFEQKVKFLLQEL